MGGFYFDEDVRIETFSFNTLADNAQDGFAFQEQSTESWAVFGSVDFFPTDELCLKAGVRFTDDKKDFAAERPEPTFNTPTVAPITRSTEADFVSWDLSAAYAVTPDVNVYGRVAKAFRAPSIQGRILFAPDFAGGSIRRPTASRWPTRRSCRRPRSGSRAFSSTARGGCTILDPIGPNRVLVDGNSLPHAPELLAVPRGRVRHARSSDLRAP